jgi:hypothetical protein
MGAMFVNQQNQHCENGYITKSNPHVQCNLNQNSNAILHRDKKKKSITKLIWKPKRSEAAKAILRKNPMLEVITIPDFKLYF